MPTPTTPQPIGAAWLGLGSFIAAPPPLGGAAAFAAGGDASMVLMDRTNSVRFDPDDPKERLCWQASFKPQRMGSVDDSFLPEGSSPRKALGCLGVGDQMDAIVEDGCRMS